MLFLFLPSSWNISPVFRVIRYFSRYEPITQKNSLSSQKISRFTIKRRRRSKKRVVEDQKKKKNAERMKHWLEIIIYITHTDRFWRDQRQRVVGLLKLILVREKFAKSDKRTTSGGQRASFLRMKLRLRIREFWGKSPPLIYEIININRTFWSLKQNFFGLETFENFLTKLLKG